MDIDGFVKNGVIVLIGGQALREGTRVTVSILQPSNTPDEKSKQRISLPMVPSPTPGTLPMTSQRVAELLDESVEPA
ncbi:MAG: hypothetical protein ACR2FY_02275 [Pirellulaceae bacterium]